MTPPSAAPPKGSERTLDVEAAGRAAVALAVPLLVLLALNRIDLAVYASFGAFTGLYGRHEPYRVRLVSVTAAAVALVSCIAAGVALASLGQPLWLTAVALAVVIAGGVFATAVIGWIPGQPVFLVFALLVCAAVPTTWSEAPTAIVTAVLSAAFAWIVCMSGWVLRRLAGDRHAHHFRGLPRSPQRSFTALKDEVVIRAAIVAVVGGLVTGAIALASGIGRPYWAVVAVVAVLPLAYAPFSLTRAWHRAAGTTVGVFIAAGILWLNLPPIAIIAIAVVCQFITEIVIAHHYGVALLFITPLAITVSNLSLPSEVLPLLADRVLETAIGCAVAAVLVLTRRWWASRASVRAS
ncbi:FUSC family protein [Homoserinimonas sp. A520]